MVAVHSFPSPGFPFHVAFSFRSQREPTTHLQPSHKYTHIKLYMPALSMTSSPRLLLPLPL
uniref:Uncharacterized protein n=1 Tax=Arundo donax TaxID=35708 RepID=A0A0A9GCY5_ARUDO